MVLAVSASDLFEFTAPAPPVAAQPYARVSPDDGGAGTQVTVTGGGFPADTEVGTGKGAELDVEINAIDGASLVAEGRPGAMAAAAFAPAGAMWHPGPALYMDKLVVDRSCLEVIGPDALDGSGPQRLKFAVTADTAARRARFRVGAGPADQCQHGHQRRQHGHAKPRKRKQSDRSLQHLHPS